MKTQYPICGKIGYFQRADVDGRVRKPKLDADKTRLKDLFAYCQAGNFREVRAVVAHYPYLLSLTDNNGFSALHHASMSGDAVFLSQVLQLYRDPKTFSLKVVCYESEEELLADIDQGFQVVGSLATGGAATTEARVHTVGKGTKAEHLGIMPGDKLEACSGTAFLSYRQPPPVATNVLEALKGGVATSFGFPVSLDFRGSAAVEILCRDGWTPSHGSAGRGSAGDQQVLLQLLSEQDRAQLAQDMVGCTPVHWAQIAKSSRARSGRRPLSAGPRASGQGSRRPPSGKFQADPVLSQVAPGSRPGTAKGKRESAVAPPADAKIERLHSAIAPRVPVPPCMSRPVTPAGYGSSGIGATAKDLAAMMMKQSGKAQGKDLLAM